MSESPMLASEARTIQQPVNNSAAGARSANL